MQFRFLSGDDVTTMAHLPGVVPPSTLLKTQPLVHTEVLLSGMFQEMKGSRGYQREREERQRPHPTMALSSKVFRLDVQASEVQSFDSNHRAIPIFSDQNCCVF
ncbi:hypothetical protein WN51_00114 [Melipona quadrifasciata]|uniref:Uncharacterized protein n=1 Tax=Melipona quadrifasciata TaxID=166423 RepID=A0A0M9ACR7_9HYME|nr:hypothetical protein WN51_00114 [Melipona quadrifasciata]